MADYRNCSAGRLLWILEQCKAKHEQDRKTGKNTLLFTAWKILFKMPENASDWYVLNHLAQFIRLPYQILEERSRFPDGKWTDTHFEWEKEVMEVCSRVSLTASLGNFIDPVSLTSYKLLRICAHEYSQAYPERRLDDVDLEGLREEVTKLLHTILKSDIPSDLKNFLWNRLWTIQTALDSYPIFGVSVVEESFYSSSSNCRNTREKWDQAKGYPSLWAAIEPVLTRFVLLVNAAEYGNKGINTAADVLTGLLN